MQITMKNSNEEKLKKKYIKFKLNKNNKYAKCINYYMKHVKMLIKRKY